MSDCIPDDIQCDECGQYFFAVEDDDNSELACPHCGRDFSDYYAA